MQPWILLGKPKLSSFLNRLLDVSEGSLYIALILFVNTRTE